MDEELMEQVEEEIEDAGVITVPIDDTLTHSGEAADAKKVGDELAKKADKTEIPNAITVNNKSKDANNNILVLADDIPYDAGQDQPSVKEKIDTLIGQTAADIPMSEEQGAQTIAEAIEDAAGRTAEDIPMSDEDLTTIAEAIGAVNDQADDNAEAIEDLQEEVGDELSNTDIDDIFSEVFEETEPEEEEET